MDPTADVIVAFEQNGKRLIPDHGYPVRMIIPVALLNPEPQPLPRPHDHRLALLPAKHLGLHHLAPRGESLRGQSGNAFASRIVFLLAGLWSSVAWLALVTSTPALPGLSFGGEECKPGNACASRREGSCDMACMLEDTSILLLLSLARAVATWPEACLPLAAVAMPPARSMIVFRREATNGVVLEFTSDDVARGAPRERADNASKIACIPEQKPR